MKAGRMDRRLVIESQSATTDDLGHQINSWSTLATVWATIEPVSGGEAIKLGADIPDSLIKVFIRYRTDITTRHRLNYQSRQWDIKYVREIGRKAGLELIAEARRG